MTFTLTPEPGDALVFWRRPLGWRGVRLEAEHLRRQGKGRFSSWAGAVAAVAVSWRIGAILTPEGSPRAPNHVGIYVPEKKVAESEYDRGVTVGRLSERYPPNRYAYIVCRFPGDPANRFKVVKKAEEIAATGEAKYDFWTILRMRAAAAVWGPEGVRQVRANTKDTRWACPEFAATCWAAGGVSRALDRYVTPLDFWKPPV